MASSTSSTSILIARITEIYIKMRDLGSLEPSNQLGELYTELLRLCTAAPPPVAAAIDLKKLPKDVRRMRDGLINLASEAEALLELDFSLSLPRMSARPLDHLARFPHYENYVKVAELESRILREHGMGQPERVAFVGSGPMPLTSILLATRHMPRARFDNFDVNGVATDAARRLVGSDAELGERMRFLSCDVAAVGEGLGEYDCVFLAALAGMSRAEKVRILGHVKEYMRRGGFLLVRSVRGARAFLYPMVKEEDLRGLKVVCVFHPNDDVINSVFLAQKL